MQSQISPAIKDNNFEKNSKSILLNLNINYNIIVPSNACTKKHLKINPPILIHKKAKEKKNAVNWDGLG